MNGLNQRMAFNQAANTDLIPCVWMQAGVVDYKLCDRSYDCDHCPFDQALHSRPANQISISIDRQTVETKASGSSSVQGCEVANNLFYHSSHTWARIEDGGMVRAGLDDFGQRLLGRAYSILLPAPNAAVECGSACWGFTHQSGVTTLAAPISGRVKEINRRLLPQPELLNHDPYGDGWTVLIEPGDLKDSLQRLMYGEQVGQWLSEEIEELRLLINKIVNGEQTSINTTMIDGGLLTREFMSGLTAVQRRQVIDSFFPLSADEKAKRTNSRKVQNGR